jgi:hypothetical protein
MAALRERFLQQRDSHESSHVLYPRQTTTQWGVVHFVFGDYRKYPEFTWRLRADTESDSVLLGYKVYAPRCAGSDE